MTRKKGSIKKKKMKSEINIIAGLKSLHRLQSFVNQSLEPCPFSPAYPVATFPWQKTAKNCSYMVFTFSFFKETTSHCHSCCYTCECQKTHPTPETQPTSLPKTDKGAVGSRAGLDISIFPQDEGVTSSAGYGYFMS